MFLRRRSLSVSTSGEPNITNCMSLNSSCSEIYSPAHLSNSQISSVIPLQSALWCPPCKAFTPDLIKFYESLFQYDENALEIIFASSDSDYESFQMHYEEMPWAAVPYELTFIKEELGSHFDLVGLPLLVILSGVDGSVKDNHCYCIDFISFYLISFL